jgi:hypothetical protein
MIHIFSYIAIFHVLQWTFQIFPPFSVFLAIFHVLQCVFFIFHDFLFSRHDPGPTVCIFHFRTFSVLLTIFQNTVFMFHLPRFSVFLPYSRLYSVPFSFYTFFSDSRHISLPIVCVCYFP